MKQMFDNMPDNPFRSPVTASSHGSWAWRRVTGLIVQSVVLAAVGALFLLLKDGRFVKDMLIFVTCIFVSGALWCRFLVSSPPPPSRRLGWYVLTAHVALLILLSLMLSAQQDRQEPSKDSLQQLPDPPYSVR